MDILVNITYRLNTIVFCISSIPMFQLYDQTSENLFHANKGKGKYYYIMAQQSHTIVYTPTDLKVKTYSQPTIKINLVFCWAKAWTGSSSTLPSARVGGRWTGTQIGFLATRHALFPPCTSVTPFLCWLLCRGLQCLLHTGRCLD